MKLNLTGYSVIIILFLISCFSTSLAVSPETFQPIDSTITSNISIIDYQKDPEMKTIGMIGGIGWSSSVVYYRLLNEMVNQRMGGDYSADILIYSIDFETFSEQERLAEQGNWSTLRRTMIDAGKRLKNGGADFIIICSNTMHSTAAEISEKTGLPILHITNATGKKIQKAGLKKVGLLGTRYTMEQGFYKDILEKNYNLTVITPDESERVLINSVIFDELVNNKITEEAKQQFIAIINHLVDRGAEGIILGCTEIPLLIQQDDVDVPVFDTMAIHAEAAVDYALNNTSFFQ